MNNYNVKFQLIGSGSCQKCQTNSEQLYSAQVSFEDKSRTYVLCKNCAVALKNSIEKKNSVQTQATAPQNTNNTQYEAPQPYYEQNAYMQQPQAATQNKNSTQYETPQPYYEQNTYTQQSKAQAAMKTNSSSASTNSVLEKKKRKLITKIVISSIILIVSIVCIFSASNSIKKNRERYPSEITEYNPRQVKSYTNIYTDISSVKPLYERHTEKNGVKTGTSTYYCACVTTNKDSFLISVSETYYNNNLKYLENNYISNKKEFKDPNLVYRIYGKIESNSLAMKDVNIDDYKYYVDKVSFIVSISSKESLENETHGTITPFIIFFAIVNLFSCLVLLKHYNIYKMYNNHINDYGDVEEIRKAVIANPIGIDNYTAYDKSFIVSLKDGGNIIATNDVLNLHEYIRNKNGGPVYKSLVAVNKYGKPIEFVYHCDSQNIKAAIIGVSGYCPNSSFGYSADAKNYIKQHKQARPK